MRFWCRLVSCRVVLQFVRTLGPESMHSLKPLKYIFVRGAPLRGTFFPMFALILLHVIVKSLAFPRAFLCVTFRHVVAARISMASAHDFWVDLKT